MHNPFSFDRKALTNKKLAQLYVEIIKPRLIEEKMLILLRQGKISKWFSGIGQEAVSVGSVIALKKDDFILPMHRNLGVFTGRKVPFKKLFGQFQGKLSGFTKGRDRSFHFGSKEHHIVGMISHLGPQLAIADGIALASKLSKKKEATLVFSGDGGSSEGDFHEALNVAAVWDLPVIFVIENNGYGLSTPSEQQFKFKSFTDKGIGYGIEAHSVEGNNILDVYNLISEVSESIRKNPRPILIEANTFRMRGHEEASGTKYVPKKLMDYWAERDPITCYEEYLLSEGVLNKKKVEAFKKEIKEEINDALKSLEDEDLPVASEVETSDVFYPYKLVPKNSDNDEKTEVRFVDAISVSLRESMEKFPELVIMGQDVAEYGGVFKVTEGFLEEFGADRIRNTPLCESAILGAGLGLSIKGFKSVIEMQFADFVSCGFNQIVNNLAKVNYRWGQNADVVIRMPTGAGVGAGPFHSQSNEAWFFHTPGLKMVYPSSPADAKGLLNSAIEDPNPYLFFEHKALYRSLTEEIPSSYYTLPVGKGAIVNEGKDLTIITYGMGVHWAREILPLFDDISIQIIDLRSLQPWDKELVFESVKRTGKALVLHEDCITGGIGGEISASITENCFQDLDAPVLRVGSLDTPVPFSKNLEDEFLAKARLKNTLKKLVDF
ncbi:MAG: dehydrogenase E1 component subunit alpha/beta [Bacteroidota bacterium]